jgi:hypothetical protein
MFARQPSSGWPSWVPRRSSRCGGGLGAAGSERARLACQRWLNVSSFGVLAPVALALRDRREGGWLVPALESLLREGSDAVLAAGLTSSDGRVRRLAYSVGIASDRCTLEPLVRIALTEGDLPVRVAAPVAAQPDGGDSGGRRAPAGPGGFPRAGLERPARSEFHLPCDRVCRPSACRPFAGGPVPRARRPAPAALAGLGETGTASDAVALRAWLRHPSPRGPPGGCRPALAGPPDR